MALYPDTATVCKVMSELFKRSMADPQTMSELRRSNLVLRLEISDPPAQFTVDARSQPPHFTCGVDAGRPDLVLHVRMDVLHQIWMGEIRLQDAFFSGQCRLDGSMLRALSLGGLFRGVEALYPGVLREFKLAP